MSIKFENSDPRAKPFPDDMPEENAAWFAANQHWLDDWKIVKQAQKERAENLLNPRRAKRRRVDPPAPAQGQAPNPPPAQGQGQGAPAGGIPLIN